MAEAWVPARTEGVRRSMVSNKASGTKPELLLREAFAQLGLTPVSVNDRRLPGKPDFVWLSKGGRLMAGFVNGCYWRRCRLCGMFDRRPPGGPNGHLWEAKFERNVQRRLEYMADLEAMGVAYVECWECELRADPVACLMRFVEAYQSLDMDRAPAV